MSDNPPLLRQRVCGSKVRSGCKTCKARRVKCDEAKPSCQRCLNAKRECQGYESSLEQSRQRSFNFIHYVGDVNPGLDVLPDIDWREKRSLSVYHDKIARELSGSFCTELWSRFIMLVAVHESAVRHAVIALSDVYEQHFGTLHKPHTETSEYALQQYGRAMNQIIKLGNSQATQSFDVALIGCIIFASLEGLQGHYQSAMTHINSGLKMLAEYDKENQSVIGTYVPRILFRQLFVRMETQILEMGNVISGLSTLQLNKCTRFTPSHFQNLDDATLSMSSYFNRLLLFLQNSDASVVQPSDSDEKKKIIEKRREDLIMNYEAWCHAFESMSFTPEDRACDITMLELYRCFLGIILRIDLKIGETTFDDFEQEFQDLVLLASVFISQVSTILPGSHDREPASNIRATLVERPDENFESIREGQCFLNIRPQATPICTSDRWSGRFRKQYLGQPILPKPGTMYKPTYSMSLGVITPLFATCVRCRNPRTRVQALYLLRMCNRKEGMWDSILTATVSDRVIKVESSAVAHLAGSYRSSDIAEHARIRDLQVLFLAHSRGIMRYLRSQACRCSDCINMPENRPQEQIEEIVDW